METIHPFYIGTQAHPEFRSRLMSPAPLFLGLMEAGLKMKLGQQPLEAVKEELQ